MAVRQYIGARYVLKIYQNSLDPSSAEWQSGVAYEPLVMVNYQNSSYISRKTVPANIGNPVANPSYWALSGLYNGQIAALQTQIADINADLVGVHSNITDINGILPTKENSLQSGKWLFVGDSFDSITDGWIDNAANRIGAESYYKMSDGGVGFTRQGSEGRTWLQMLIYRIEHGSIDPDLVKYVCVVGGGNDNNADELVLDTAISDFIAYCKTNFPQLDSIFIGYCGFTSSAYIINSIATASRYKQAAIRNVDVYYIDGLFPIPYTPANMLTTDPSHPNSTGTAFMVQGIVTGVYSGFFHYFGRSGNAATLNSAAITSATSGFNIVVFNEDNVVNMTFAGTGQMTFNEGYRTGTVSSFMTFEVGSPIRTNQFLPILLYNRTARTSIPCTLHPNSSNIKALDLIFPPSYDAGTDLHYILAQTLTSII